MKYGFIILLFGLIMAIISTVLGTSIKESDSKSDQLRSINNNIAKNAGFIIMWIGIAIIIIIGSKD